MAAGKQSDRFTRHLSLVTLTLQNALLGLCTRYSRTRPGDMFFTSSAVLMGEVVKLFAGLLLVMKDEGSVSGLVNRLYQYLWLQWRDTVKVCVPSLLYTVQNNLLYVAASNLEVATYQVTYQLKILTTALFTVVFLRRPLLRSQWLSLLVLVMGVALVQTSQQTPPPAAGGRGQTPPILSLASEVRGQSQLLGLAAAISACLLSGAAGVYFEWVLKSSDVSVWMRNVQMSMLSIPLALITALLGGGVQQHGLLFGFDWFVWLVVLQNAMGGLLVAVVVKYADNILKGFATSLAIIISAVVSIYLFNFVVSLQFSLGTTLVIGAVFLYGYRPPQPANITAARESRLSVDKV